jgi:hypothetical protein
MTAISAARADYAAGLRILADAIEADPNMPLLGTTDHMLFAHNRDEFVTAAALLKDATHHRIESGSLTYKFRLDGRIAGLQVTVFAKPEDACERLATRMVEQTKWAYNGDVVAVSA